MKTKWLLIGVALLMTVLAIGAVACGDDDDDDDEAPTATEEPADDVVDDDEDMDDDMILQLVASLTEMDGSGASGEAEISANGDGILVSIDMTGLPAGERANHLHHGTCTDDPPGEVHITLDSIVADESGDGSQTTSNDEQSIDHFAEGHYLAVHGEDGAIISCGDVVAPAA